MIKKNKLSLFLLAVVMMLSIYYINMPDEYVSAPVVGENVVTKYPEFATMRLELLEEREQLVAEFENVLASASTTDTDKNDAYLSMQEILELTESEVLAETFVLNLGYLDCFVENDSRNVSVYILNYNNTIEDFFEVCSIMSGVFGNNIKVTIQPVSI